MKGKTCGECYFGAPIPPSSSFADAGKGVEHRILCMLNPPTVHMIMVPHPLDPKQAQPGFLTSRPNLLDTEPACGQFTPEPEGRTLIEQP